MRGPLADTRLRTCDDFRHGPTLRRAHPRPCGRVGAAARFSEPCFRGICADSLARRAWGGDERIPAFGAGRGDVPRGRPTGLEGPSRGVTRDEAVDGDRCRSGGVGGGERAGRGAVARGGWGEWALVCVVFVGILREQRKCGKRSIPTRRSSRNTHKCCRGGLCPGHCTFWFMSRPWTLGSPDWRVSNAGKR